VTAVGRDRRELLVLFAAALALRGVSALQTVVMFDDGPRFLEVAQRIAEGRWLDAIAHPYHPLYPALIAFAQVLGAPPAPAAVAIACGFGAASVVALAVFLRDAFGRAAGRVGGWLAAMLPYSVIYASDLQSEGVYLAFFALGVAAAWRALQPGAAVGAAALAGLASGLAYATRPEGLGVAAVTAVLAVGSVLARRMEARAAVRCVAALGLGAAVCVGPYVLALHAVHGEWRLTSKKSVAALATPPGSEDAEPAPPSAAPPRGGGGARLASPLRAAPVPPPAPGPDLLDALGRIGVAVASIFRSLVGGLLLLGLFGVRGPPGPRGVFLAAFVGAYGAVLMALVLTYGYVDRRHVLPPSLLLLGYAALAVPILGRVATPLAHRLGRPSTPRLHAVAGLVLCAVLLLPKALAPHRTNRLAELRAARWIAARGEPEVGVAAPKRRVAWYAEARPVPLWPGPRGSTGRQLRRSGADYLVIEEEAFARHPRLEEGRGPGLREVHRESARGHVAIVYELSP